MSSPMESITLAGPRGREQILSLAPPLWSDGEVNRGPKALIDVPLERRGLALEARGNVTTDDLSRLNKTS